VGARLVVSVIMRVSESPHLFGLCHLRTYHLAGCSERSNDLQDSVCDSGSDAAQRMARDMQRRLGTDFHPKLPNFRYCGTSSVPLAMLLGTVHSHCWSSSSIICWHC
jgi:hypothetical protein